MKERESKTEAEKKRIEIMLINENLVKLIKAANDKRREEMLNGIYKDKRHRPANE
jgi:hypothetical protein